MDNSPVKNTCPLIDEIISCIDDVEFPNDGWYDKNSATEILEKIRSANEELRTWGNEQHVESCEFENERDSLQKDLEKQEHELNELKSEIEGLNNKIEDLEEEIYTLNNNQN